VRTSIVNTSSPQGHSGAGFPGMLLRSRDGGVKWERIAIPDNRLVDQVYTPTGDPNDLVIAGPLSRDDDEETKHGVADEPDRPDHRPVTAVDDGDHGFARADADEPDHDKLENPRTWIRTRDGGNKWQHAAKVPDRLAKQTVELGGDVYEATRDGLYRTR